MTASSFQTIKKPPIEEMKVKPNLDYDAVRGDFSWQQVYDQLDWLPGGYLNIAHEAIDRHANGRNRDKVALIWEGKNGEKETYTFGDLKVQSDKFANVLWSLGIGKGDSVFIMMERIPEYYIAFFGILKVGATAGPIFSAFDAEIVKVRMKETDTKVLVTSPELRRKITRIIPELFELQHIVVVNKDNRDPFPLDTADLSYEEEMDKATANHETALTSQNDNAILSYTSGSTGDAKGVLHRHLAVAQLQATGNWVLDLHDNDVYWSTTDPSWITGTSYGIIAPWTNATTQFVYEGGFQVEKWYQLIEEYNISVMHSAPTAINKLMDEGSELPRHYDLTSLRFLASAGENLSAEVVTWGQKALGTPIHDTWLQTETGAIMCANYAGKDIHPGSMGLPIPGVELGVVDDEFNRVDAGVEGNLVVRPEWPSMFQGYWNNNDAYNSRFLKGWYITGDRAEMSEDGYFWFAGRAD